MSGTPVPPAVATLTPVKACAYYERMNSFQLRARGSLKPPRLILALASDIPLAEVARTASRLGQMAPTVDIMHGESYLVSYCGGSPYWWPAGGEMHQVGSHGWCHDCHKAGLGYVHHLDYDAELAVLAAEAREDPVLREQCEADGLTPEQYAAGVAGRAVPLDGDYSFAIAVHELGVNADGLAEFAVDMWDMTTWKVAVPVAEGAPGTAERKAEELALAAQPARCYSCKGRDGQHSRRCQVTRWAEFEARYGKLLPSLVLTSVNLGA